MKNLNRLLKGFSILEALIALLVVGVAMLGLGKMQGVNLASSGDSRIRSHAVNLAQDKIEEFRKFANQDFYTNNFTGSSDAKSFDNVNFTRNWTFSSCPNSGAIAVSCKKIAVTVAWTDNAGASQTVRLTSYIAETDPVMAGVALDSASIGSSSTSSSTGSSTTSSSTTGGSTTTSSSTTGGSTTTSSSTTGGSTTTSSSTTGGSTTGGSTTGGSTTGGSTTSSSTTGGSTTSSSTTGGSTTGGSTTGGSTTGGSTSGGTTYSCTCDKVKNTCTVSGGGCCSTDGCTDHDNSCSSKSNYSCTQ